MIVYALVWHREGFIQLCAMSSNPGLQDVRLHLCARFFRLKENMLLKLKTDRKSEITNRKQIL